MIVLEVSEGEASYFDFGLWFSFCNMMLFALVLGIGCVFFSSAHGELIVYQSICRVYVSVSLSVCPHF